MNVIDSNVHLSSVQSLTSNLKTNKNILSMNLRVELGSNPNSNIGKGNLNGNSLNI
jgi:hypothetical protein